ncbi:MAG: Phosphoribosyltransferase [Verrucomicrobia bacterium]|nr:Phosphoribosyltransferase [Verrucomicrobiota bacterium]
MNPGFRDRATAGGRLAEMLAGYAGHENLVVLALPRGGVPVGFAVAQALGAPLDVFVVRKLGVPGFEELAMGAIASGGARVLNPSVLRRLPKAETMLAQATAREAAELTRRERLYREGRPALEVRGRTVIVVDDGLATGASMRAAVAALRQLGAARIVAAVPVGDPGVCAQLRSEVDEVACAVMPAYFEAVGQFYDDFSQTTDEEVRVLLARSRSAEG